MKTILLFCFGLLATGLVATHAGDKLTTMKYQLPAKFLEISGDASKDAAQVKRALEIKGITFPAGSSVRLERGNTLYMKNTTENHGLLAELLRNVVIKPIPVELNKAFDWNGRSWILVSDKATGHFLLQPVGQ